MNTIIGGIARMIQEDSQEDTPLQRKLAQLGKLLGTACLVICALVLAWDCSGAKKYCICS